MTDERERPVALSAYEQLADAYAERAPTKPFNADLERPTTQALLPTIMGWDVLDAGCGPGITTKHLLGLDATVTGLDASSSMLSHARDRAPQAEFLRADLGAQLPFKPKQFDLVYSSLVFDYVEDWEFLFSELARVLRSNGMLVFSCGHPVAETLRIDPDDYFETEAITETWNSFGDPVEVPFYRRPLEATLNPLSAAGFRLDRVAESKPTDRFRQKAPEMYERVSREPTFWSIRAVLTAK